MALPHFHTLPHYGGQHYYCPICYKQISMWKTANLPECKCNRNGKELLVFNNNPKENEMKIKRKLFLRMKKLERIENE